MQIEAILQPKFCPGACAEANWLQHMQRGTQGPTVAATVTDLCNY